MIRRLHVLAWVLAVLTAGLVSAVAERLVISVSKHRVLITSGFVGEELVLFGAIERDAATIARRGGYDIVATIVGPPMTLVTRRRERRLGIWINVDSREFVRAPSFLAVLSNRPVEQIAHDELRRKLQVGIEQIPLYYRANTKLIEAEPADPFRRALVRLNMRQRLYSDSPTGVTFLTPELFRASIALPAWVAVGTYHIDVKLFADGVMLTRAPTAFEVVKVGFEQFVADAAHHYPFLYGLITALMALSVGWIGSIVFRRD